MSRRKVIPCRGCRTLEEIQVALEAKGIKMSRMGIHVALKRAERKLKEALAEVGITEAILER